MDGGKHQIRPILAGLIGNMLEWYDFALYGYFAPVIAEQFFPSSDKLASLMATFAVFAAGYLTRPLGGVLFGHLADRTGRQRALQLSVLTMALPTFLLGLMPTYAQIGLASSALLMILRLLQGCSVGGEFTTSITFLSDMAPPGRRYFTACWVSVGAILGMMMGSAVGALITSTLPHDQLLSWGWRVPFLLGIAVGAAGLALRRGLHVPPAGPTVHSPFKTVLASHPKLILKLTLSCLSFTAGYYMLFLYLSTYLSTETGIPQAQALRLNTFCMLVLALLIPVAGQLADKVSGRLAVACGYGALAALAIPLFYAMDKGDASVDLACQLTFAVVFAVLEGVLPGFMVGVFPSQVRATGVAICYNTAAALFGGTTPLLATALIAHTGDKLSPSYYLTVVALVSMLATLSIPTPDQESPAS